MTVTTEAKGCTLGEPPGRWLATSTAVPSGVTAAATGSRTTSTRLTSRLVAKSITATSLLNRLQTYNRFPLGVTAAPVAVCPVGIAAIARHESVSITTTVLFGAAQVTINFVPSELRTRPVGSAGTSRRRLTSPVGKST